MGTSPQCLPLARDADLDDSDMFRSWVNRAGRPRSSPCRSQTTARPSGLTMMSWNGSRKRGAATRPVLTPFCALHERAICGSNDPPGHKACHVVTGRVIPLFKPELRPTFLVGRRVQVRERGTKCASRVPGSATALLQKSLRRTTPTNPRIPEPNRRMLLGSGI
jgi:hypothetical protein